MPPSSSWYVYMIEATNGSLYTGVTTDITRRLEEHKSGSKGAKFFKSSRAKEVVYLEKVKDRSTAQKKEAAIKKLSRQEKLKLLSAKSNKLSILV